VLTLAEHVGVVLFAIALGVLIFWVVLRGPRRPRIVVDGDAARRRRERKEKALKSAQEVLRG
jgi:hypothetical protein